MFLENISIVYGVPCFISLTIMTEAFISTDFYYMTGLNKIYTRLIVF